MAVLVDWESAPLTPGPGGRAPLPLGGYLPPTILPADPGRADPGHSDPGHADPGHGDPGRGDPDRPGPRSVDPRRRRVSSSRSRPSGLTPAPSRRPTVSSCERTYARRRFVALLIVGLVAAAAVIGLAMLRSVATDDGVPTRTAVVEVRTGETLWDLAHRVAPQSPPQAVVERIRELNDMRGSTVHPGQPLVVPAAS